jgi:hypothetical protein
LVDSNQGALFQEQDSEELMDKLLWMILDQGSLSHAAGMLRRSACLAL